MNVIVGIVLLAGLTAMSNAGTIRLGNSAKMTLTGTHLSLTGTHLKNTKMTLTGSGTINVNPIESFWDGLTNTRRFPVILSGDLVAFKLSRSSGTPKWMQCSKSSYCTTSTCPGGPVITSAKFSSCPTVVFRIKSLGKVDGQAVEAGDYVMMTFPTRGETFYFHCSSSTSSPCYATGNLGLTVWPRKNWFKYNYYKFQIFAKNAVEGQPIQYGDIVGFRYDYQSNKAWLYSDGSKIYARSCTFGNYSTYYKSYCTKVNTGFGFNIYKKI